jgi:hypothetical protein
MPRTSLYEREIEALSVPAEPVKASKGALDMHSEPSGRNSDAAKARPPLTDIEQRVARAYEAYRAAETPYERSEWLDVLYDLRELMRAEWVTRGIITEEQFMRMR